MTTDAAAPDPLHARSDARLDGRPDGRAARTAQALRAAILRLAAEQHVDRISVAQIAQAADIHRVTFYDHARSPSALLARVIRDELDGVQREYFASGVVREHTLRESVRQTALGVAALVDSHRAIFTHLLAEHSRTTAHDLLAPHFEQTLGELISSRADAAGAASVTEAHGAAVDAVAVDPAAVDAVAVDPAAVDAAASPNADAALARYVAYGSVGAMEVWFAGDQTRDPENYYRLIAPLLPGWLVA